MSVDAEIIETIDAVLGGDHTARIGQDAARIEELASCGFEGLAYEVFEIELVREAEPRLLGMLREGTLARLAVKQCKSRGWKFFVHEDDMRLLRSSPFRGLLRRRAPDVARERVKQRDKQTAKRRDSGVVSPCLHRYTASDLAADEAMGEDRTADRAPRPRLWGRGSGG